VSNNFEFKQNKLEIFGFNGGEVSGQGFVMQGSAVIG
jgi:hypothetical protein